MENFRKKCSLKEHKNINAQIYCKKCEIFMCNKCEVHHSKLFENHQNFILNNNIEEFFDEFCEEETHNLFKLKYFCKTHNKLCCAACITKIKGKNDGQHNDCKVCCVEDIKEEKKKSLKENIKILEELSLKFNESFNEIKNKYEQINKNKEEIKLKIQKIFTNIRNILNKREDELLLEVDKEYDNQYFKENFLRDIEKLPNKIKLSLEKCRNIDNINDNNFYRLIKECTEIENNINIINNINNNINKVQKSDNLIIRFIPEENEMNDFFENIKKFGNLKITTYNISILSSIIKDDLDSNELINKWIEESINKKEIKFELIFRMSEIGNKASDFHKYCDKKGPTLTLIRTTKNKIFGGFTPLNWSQKEGLETDINNRTFVFSLSLKKKFNLIKKDGYAIYCSKLYGPEFGNCDFRLKKNMKSGITYANNASNFLSDNNLELTGGKGQYEEFEVDEFEVFKVMY